MNKASAFLIAAAVIAGAAAPASAQQAEGGTAALAATVSDPQRPEGDIARDPQRKPAEVVKFAGVKPGDVVAEIAPGGGYYTRILAGAVGPEGHVYAMMPAVFANRPGGLDAINALAKQYGNVTVVVADFGDFTLPQPADLVWTTENYHDLANGDIAAVNAAVFAALKPGGIYFVEDHAAPGTGTSATRTLHRIDEEAVKQQVMQAGFTLEAESDLLHNPADPHDVNPREVQPTSDKFALRFRKPG
ncbi:conserved hypothetical protein [Altererythrobacter sp. B11]|uniref:class I SAM-dependent methyltransferase n=1 Tax=Altererythrobacter sp. B11 TaxID=2060312 RepID=UPI000DC7250A|nr:methyltransferase domain-containing protein [Altererythrobacter sp. B11]BBC72885.1 conserved hypothetical protein [Altererythrobacter sp. B11]